MEQLPKGFSFTKMLQQANETREQVWVLVLIPYLALCHIGFFPLVSIDWSCRRQPEAHLILLKMFFLLQLDLVLPVNKVHLDLTSLLTTMAQNAVVLETRGLTRCLLSETTTKTGQKEMVLNTEGINVHELLQHSDVRACQTCGSHLLQTSATDV